MLPVNIGGHSAYQDLDIIPILIQFLTVMLVGTLPVNALPRNGNWNTILELPPKEIIRGRK